MATDTRKEKVIIDRNDRNPINAVFWVFGIIILIFLFFMLFGGMSIFSGGETTPAPVTPTTPTRG